MLILFLATLASCLAIAFAFYLIWRVKRHSQGEGKMVEIAKAISEGAKAYLNRQYRTVAMVAVVISALLFWAFDSWLMVVGFLIGAAASALAGYIGMFVSVRANVRTTEAAKKGIKQALNVAVKGGTVTGIFVVSLGLLGWPFHQHHYECVMRLMVRR